MFITACCHNITAKRPRKGINQYSQREVETKWLWMGKASRVGNDGRVVSTKGSRAEGGDKRPPVAPLRLCKPPALES